MIDDEYEDSIVGTPQGGNLSPLLANIMLNELDKEMEKRGLNFVRYADDCIIMVRSEMSANRVMRNISRFIEEKLGLKVNMTKSKVDRPSGLKYLGFGFYFDARAHQFKAKPHAKSVAKPISNMFIQLFTKCFHTAYLEVINPPSDELIKFFHLIAVANAPATTGKFFHSLLKLRH